MRTRRCDIASAAVAWLSSNALNTSRAGDQPAADGRRRRRRSAGTRCCSNMRRPRHSGVSDRHRECGPHHQRAQRVEYGGRDVFERVHIFTGQGLHRTFLLRFTPYWCPGTSNACRRGNTTQHRRAIVPQLLLQRATLSVLFAQSPAFGVRSARADGLVIAGGSPRSIGRAGVGTVSDDGGGALLLDPAVLARRDTTRVQVGIAFVDDSVEWLHAASSPLARDQSGSSTMPLIAVEGSWGEWILGAGAMTSTVSERELRSPGSLDAAHYGTAFEYRYVGHLRRRASRHRHDRRGAAVRRLARGRRFGRGLARSVSTSAARSGRASSIAAM